MVDKMIKSIEEKYGKSFQEWVNIVKKSGKEKHGEMLKFLKTEHGFSHGFANFVVHKARQSDAGSTDNTEDLVDNQYKGKENLKPIFDRILDLLKEIGSDIEIAPKKAYVSIRRKKQFALIQPSTKSRVDVGINIKGKSPESRLELSGSFNAMVSHRVKLAHVEEVNEELRNWLDEAYSAAG